MAPRDVDLGTRGESASGAERLGPCDRRGRGTRPPTVRDAGDCRRFGPLGRWFLGVWGRTGRGIWDLKDPGMMVHQLLGTEDPEVMGTWELAH